MRVKVVRTTAVTVKPGMEMEVPDKVGENLIRLKIAVLIEAGDPPAKKRAKKSAADEEPSPAPMGLSTQDMV